MTLDAFFIDISPWIKLLAYFIASLLGMVCHWLKKHLRGNELTFGEWVGVEMPTRILALMVSLVASIPTISVLNLATTSALVFFSLGFSTGYMSDSIFSREGLPFRGDKDSLNQ